ncbi:MAG: DUF3311 domain-containing protein [Candidatus Baltobacteraceae bacterium]
MFSLRTRVSRVVLALIPSTMLSLAIPLVNRIEPRIFGLPFILAWIVLWVLLTPAFLYCIYRLEGRS